MGAGGPDQGFSFTPVGAFYLVVGCNLSYRGITYLVVDAGSREYGHQACDDLYRKGATGSSG